MDTDADERSDRIGRFVDALLAEVNSKLEQSDSSIDESINLKYRYLLVIVMSCNTMDSTLI